MPYDGCRRACRLADNHTLVPGECENAPDAEETISISKVYTDTDGGKSIGFDVYTIQEVADLIEPALRELAITLGANAVAALTNGLEVDLSGGEYASLALNAADALFHRNDPKTPPNTEELELLLEQQERNHAALGRERDSYRDAWKYEQTLRMATRRRMRLAFEIHEGWCQKKPCHLCHLLKPLPPFPTKEEMDL